MNSFTLTAIGNLAQEPELATKGDAMYTRFCLVGNDYGGKDDQGNLKQTVTSMWFVAFGALGEAIARNARKGDQLIITAFARANNWIDKQGRQQYALTYVVEGFRFGAPGKTKREAFAENGMMQGPGPDGSDAPISPSAVHSQEMDDLRVN